MLPAASTVPAASPSASCIPCNQDREILDCAQSLSGFPVVGTLAAELLPCADRGTEDVGEAVGGGDADVALAGEEAGDDDLGDAGFLADLIDRLGAFFDRCPQGVAETAGYNLM